MSKIDLTTVAKRARLPIQKNPHFMSINGPRGSVSLGWRRPGRWIAKLAIDGDRKEEKIGDSEELGGMDYKAASVAAHVWADLKRSQTGKEDKLTVGAALEAYAERKGANGARFVKHATIDKAFCAIRLEKLTVEDIEAWRTGLARRNGRCGQTLKATSLNRIVNALRAALNDAASRHFLALPAHFKAIIKKGTENLDVSRVEAARPMSILEDAEVAQAIQEAYALDEDFGDLTLIMAATGARHSQLVRIKVRDLLLDSVWVPGAFKGKKKAARPPQQIMLTPAVREKLARLIIGRGADEPLLMRWVQKRQGMQWVNAERRAWGPANEVEKKWDKVCNRVGLPRATVMYSLRHTSIVRGLKAGLPDTLVAQQHDTSVSQLERTYALHMSKASHEMLKRTAFKIA